MPWFIKHTIFCEMEEEIISHSFYYSTHMQDIQNQVQTYFTDCLYFSHLIPQTAIFAFHNIDNGTFLIQNHMLVLLKLHMQCQLISFNNFL